MHHQAEDDVSAGAVKGLPDFELRNRIDELHRSRICLRLSIRNPLLHALAKVAKMASLVAVLIVFPIIWWLHAVSLLYFLVSRVSEGSADLLARILMLGNDLPRTMTLRSAAWGSLWWSLGILALWGTYRAGMEAAIPPRRLNH